MAKSSHSAESSGYSSISSENSATQISRQIVGLTLSGRESESTNGASPAADNYNSHVQHLTRRSERLQDNLNDRSGSSNAHRDDASDPDVGPPRKRLKSNIHEPDYHHTEEQQDMVTDRRIDGQDTPQIRRNGDSLSAAVSGAPNKTSERLEQDREDWSRSSGIFSENRKLAVVIDNRSRSTSTSTSGRKGHQKLNNWFQTPTTIKGSQETPVLLSRTRHQTSLQNRPPPTSYQDSQPIVIGSDDDEIPSPPQCTHRVLPSEVKNSQEFEEELTDAPMSLDSTDVYSPLPQERSASAAWGYAELPWRPEEENRLSVDPEILTVQRDPHAQQYPGNPHGKDTNGNYTSREYREPSSPPYSPPPPDVPETLLEPVNRAESYISPPRTTIQDDQSTRDDGFVCRKCRFHTKNNGQYKDKLWYEPNP